MMENGVSRQGEVNILDISQIFHKGGLNLVVGIAVGIICAIVATNIIPPTYEATAILQVGQVAGQPVETAAQAVERMKTPAFQMKVAETMGLQEWVDALRHSSNGATPHLTPLVVKSTAAAGANPLIELKARNGSPDEARNILSASISLLAQKHSEIAKPTIDRMQLDLAIAKEKLASAEKELNEIGKLVSHADVKDSRFTQLSLMTTLRIQKESELFNQRQTIMSLETALSAPSTQSAKAIEAIYVPEKPISPKRGLLMALGIFGGLSLGIVSIFVLNIVQRFRTIDRS